MQNSTHDYQFNILLMGASKVGKTSILSQFVDGIFKEEVPQTIGKDLMIKTMLIDNVQCKLFLWEEAGVQQFTTSWSSSYRLRQQVMIFVFDISNRDSIKRVIEDVNEVNHQTLSQDYNAIEVYMIVGNKSDLNEIRQISQDEASQLSRDLNCLYIEVSSKQNKGIQQMFELIIRAAISKQKPNQVQLSKQPMSKSSNCI